MSAHLPCPTRGPSTSPSSLATLVQPARPPSVRPFPPLPFELKVAILQAGADKAYSSSQGFQGVDEQVAVYTFLRNASLVCRDFRLVTTHLLYRHVVVRSPGHAHRLLHTLQTSPSVLPLIHSFEWPAWDRDPRIKTNYPAVTHLRAKLIELILPSPTLVICVFPTIAWPLLTPSQTTLGPSSLRTLGTVLAVQNQALSSVLDCPRFESLEELRIWWGDPSSGDVRFPPLLRTLHIRCDNYHHGNNIPLAPFPAYQTRHLPHLTHLSFSFTTITYPNAPRPPPVPALLSAVGATLTKLTLVGDRDSKPENLFLPTGILQLCPKLRVLELANHRPVDARFPGDGKQASASLEEIRYRFDDWYPLDDAHTIDRTAILDLVHLLEEQASDFPRLKRVVLVGVPTKKTDAIEMLGRLRSLRFKGVAVTDESGRTLDSILGEMEGPSPWDVWHASRSLVALAGGSNPPTTSTSVTEPETVDLFALTGSL